MEEYIQNHIPSFCISLQLIAWEIVGDLTDSTDLLNVPGYKDMIEHVYLAACNARSLSTVLGDKDTAKSLSSALDKIVKLANL